MTDLRRSARTWLVAGFALLTVGALVDVVVLINNDYLGEGNVRADTQLFLQPIGALAALLAWRILSQLTVADPSDRRPFRRAFYALAVWMFVDAVTQVNYLWSFHSFGQYQAAEWIDALGSSAAVVGFVLMARAIGAEPVPESSD